MGDDDDRVFLETLAPTKVANGLNDTVVAGIFDEHSAAVASGVFAVFEEHRTLRIPCLLVRREFDTLSETDRLDPLDELIDEVEHHTRIALGSVQALLVVIELFEHRRTDEDVVLLEAEKRQGIVHEHVRVEDVKNRLISH